ncbi:hypothetical protein if_gp31 [Streptococcus phage SW6]|uniref:Uncharacterized protein n=1 Tax=Streptococcus phage SW6 TaxID=2419655 RepID=A0A3S5H0J8_9CAUD|nr:hypothetical protein if_gp31 [Streptococcus phage SW6]AYP29063.1 hypothetical protein SW6_031 [Streptococcus phage SW6]AYP30016.1 hypothetical protein SW30_030 [Streptococcus phage SW30]
MKILAIDPSSAKAETSTNGIVLLDNAKLLKYWVVGYSVKDIRSWYENEGRFIKPDIAVIEKYEARDNDLAKDNSVLETIALFQILFPDAILQRNAGYQSDIPNPLLKKIGLWKFDKSHHQDVRAAARLGLFWAMRNDIEEVVQDIGKAVSGYINQT